MSHYSLFVDGASRGNPGKSGAGVVLLKDQAVVLQKGFYLGPFLTNNEAEYMALIVGLTIFKKKFGTTEQLNVFSDSQLMVRQLNHIYRVKQPHLALLKAKVDKSSLGIKISFSHVMREKNCLADAMANQGVDGIIILPKYLSDTLK
jgi:ribonuclease HI